MRKRKTAPSSVTLPLPPHVHHSSNHSLLGRRSTSCSERCNAHFLPLQEYEGTGENKTNEQTRTICLGLTQEQKESYATLCIPDSIYGLTLAWVTSENSTKQLECRLILTRSSSLSLDPISCWLASLLRCLVSTASVRFPSPTAVSSFSQPTLFRVPLPLPDTARFQVQKPFVWFRAKTDKGIVCLAGHPHSVTAEGALGTPDWVWRSESLETRCGRESQHPAESWALGPPVEQPWRTGKKRWWP